MSPVRGRGAGTDALLVVGCLAALGVVCGVLWWLAVDPAEFTKLKGGGAMGEAQLGKRFNADGWYVVLALVPGFVAGLALTWWRSRDPLLTSGLLVVGAAAAAAVMAYVGHLLGPPDPNAVLAAGKVGAHAAVQLGVAAWTAYLAWPIGVLAGALLVLWSKPLEPRG
ncbi:MAG: hypothetical protein ACTHOK_18560 [Nocardioidaceae bacterium]